MQDGAIALTTQASKLGVDAMQRATDAVVEMQQQWLSTAQPDQADA
jgi:hypothetical protein